MMLARLFFGFFFLLSLFTPSWAQIDGDKPSESPASSVEGAADRQKDSSRSEQQDFMGPSGGAFSGGGDTGFGLGTAIGDPTSLNGPNRTETVLNGTTRSSTVNLTGHYIWKPADNQRLLLEVNVDPEFLGTDISYSWQPQDWKGVLTGNVFLSSAKFAPFQEVSPTVRLPNYEEPFLQQGGFGLEYVQGFGENFDLAVAMNYQNFAYSDGLLGGDRYPRDFTGTPLALGLRATGDLYGFQAKGIYSTLDDRNLPTEGTKVRVGVEQTVALGNSSTGYTRLSANLAHLFRVPGFNAGKHSLLVDVQGGTLLGNEPQLSGFHLGGPFSVRGYNPGEMASGQSFLQGTLEYRHHLKDFTVFDQDIEMRGSAFVDYGTVLGTEKQLKGIPEYLWDKPKTGTGYGVGLQFGTSYGLFRIETAWNDRGSNTSYLTVGERF